MAEDCAQWLEICLFIVEISELIEIYFSNQIERRLVQILWSYNIYYKNVYETWKCSKLTVEIYSSTVIVRNITKTSSL